MNLYYIAGAGRSGSTIFAQVLSSELNAYNIGEYFLSYCREEMYIANLPCSCGLKPSTCNEWEDINRSIDLDSLKNMSAKSRTRNVFFEPTKQETKYFNQLVENINLKFGSESAIIETSKSPAFLRYLLGSNINLTVIHLTRNPADSIKSWMVAKEYLNAKTFFGGVHDWVVMNYLTAIYLKSKRFKYIRVKYEYFSKNPRLVMSNIVGETGQATKVKVDPNQNEFPQPTFNHALAGNPSKFSSSNLITIKPSKSSVIVNVGVKKWLLKVIGLPFGYSNNFK